MTSKKVLVFGTFDVLHPGHEYFLREASALGELHAVIARDETVKQLKGRLPQDDERTRMMNVYNLPYVHAAYLGNLDDKFRIIVDIKPDIIFLGYDQRSFTDGLEAEVAKRNLNAQIIRSDNAHKPEIYKSSKLRKRV